ncbi:YlbG family protein [Lacticigenium naphthae]|uniref:YlbG family protein n=1 Tax=Lacticigenium naphthae TaxID=515351 RepID=UPI00041ADE93|nr:YlbG family protein [Lacticigenium naphthae]
MSEENEKNRQGLIIWIYTPKFINKLKRYGLIHYISKKMNYVVLYVDQDKLEETIKKITKFHFVRRVEPSYRGAIKVTYDGVLDSLRKEKKEDEKHSNPMDDLSLL